MRLEINYTFTLAPDVRGAWKKVSQNLLAPWLIRVRIFLRNPSDLEALIHELVESYIAQLIVMMEFVNYKKACRIAHTITTISRMAHRYDE